MEKKVEISILLEIYGNLLTEKQKENQDNDPIEETLFFYPMIGMLHELSENIKN